MAEGGEDVIHVGSFNIHRSHDRRSRRRELITISDDSDDEPVTRGPTRGPGSPVLVPDDDDVSILEALPPRRQVIRPAATWSGSPAKPTIQATTHSTLSAFLDAVAPGLSREPMGLDAVASTSRDARGHMGLDAVASTSRDAKGHAKQPVVKREPQAGSSTTTHSQSSQPKPSSITPKPRASTLTVTTSDSQARTCTFAPFSTSRDANKATVAPGPSRLPDPPAQPPQPSTSSGNNKAQPQPGTSASTAAHTHTHTQSQASTSNNIQVLFLPAITVLGSTSSTQVTISTSNRYTLSQENPQPGASSAATHTRTDPAQPSTSKQTQLSVSISAQTHRPLVTILEERRPQTPYHQRMPPNPAPGHVLVPFGLNRTAEARETMVVFPPPPPAVLIAAAPERLGRPEVGHRITVGSQGGVVNPNPQPLAEPNQPNPNARVPNNNPNPPAAAIPHPPRPNPILRQATLIFAPALAPAPAPAPVVPAPPAPNPEGALNPAHAPFGVPPPPPPPAPPADDVRPGPSVPREGNRPEYQPHIRALIRDVLDLFPDAQETYVADLVQQNNDINFVCNALLENPYPRREAATAVPTSILLESGESQAPVTEDLFDYSRLGVVGAEAQMQAADLLMADFRMLKTQDLKWALNNLKGHYAITRKALCEAMKKWQESEDPSGKRLQRIERGSSIDFQFEHGSVKYEKKMFFLSQHRRHFKSYGMLEESVQKELSFYLQKAKEWAEHEDFLLALQVNEDEYKKDGQLIECGCCYGEYAFEKMTQCSDGHLFCKECLVKYAQEAVFGSGQSELSCMESGCTCSYPVCELEKVLPENILLKYYERQAEEAVAATCGDELVRCPFCNFPALLDKGMSLFSCPNPACRKESCRKCHVQWKQHAGKTCQQVMEMDEIKMRVLIEERMTAARVRKCVKCAMGLVKSEGCNRMSCRCGSFMCYLCREPINGYNHFCQHVRSPGAPCRHCHKCSLWTDPTQDDERIIQEIQKEGEAELNKNKTSPENSGKRVGPPPEPAATKRPRVGPPPDNPPPPPPPNPPLPNFVPHPPQVVRAPFLPVAPGRVPVAADHHHIVVMARDLRQRFVEGPHRVRLEHGAPPVAPYVPALQHLAPLDHHHPAGNDLPMHYGPRYYRRF